MNMNVLIATRFSDAKQIGNTSTETQLEICNKYCKDNCLNAVAYHKVEAESAGASNVARIAELLDFCKQYEGKAQALVVFKLDRFARDVSLHYYLKSELLKIGITLRSATEPIDSSPVGELMETVLAGIAQFDNSVKRERVKLAMRHLLENGIWPWKAPTGYKNIKNSNDKADVSIYDDACAGQIKELFELYGSGKVTQMELVRILKEKIIYDYSGKRINFTPQLINKILNNKFYIGILKTRDWDQEYEGKHKPLISADLFNTCQQILNPNHFKGIKHTRDNPIFPLRDRLFCGLCGHKMTAAVCSGKAKKYPVYYCMNKKCTARQKSIWKDNFETEFQNYLFTLKPDEEALGSFLKAVMLKYYNRKVEFENNSSIIIKQLEELEKEKQYVLGLGRKGILDEDDLRDQLKEVKGKITSAKLALNECHGEEFKTEYLLQLGETILRNFPAIWNEVDITYKIRLQRVLFPEKIIYSYPGFSNTKLSPVFGQIEDFTASNVSNVTPLGFEPKYQG